MTEEQDLTQGQEGAGEAAEPTEEPQAQPPADPLDAIQDETARAEAKKWRAIARREGKKPDAPAPAPAPSNSATKDDLALIVTNQAKELVDAEVREHWDELSKIPLGGFNAMNARSIADNMAQRLTLYKAQQKPSNGAEDLTKSPGVRGTTGTTTSEPKKHNFPRPMDVDKMAEKLYN